MMEASSQIYFDDSGARGHGLGVKGGSQRRTYDNNIIYFNFMHCQLPPMEITSLFSEGLVSQNKRVPRSRRFVHLLIGRL